MADRPPFRPVKFEPLGLETEPHHHGAGARFADPAKDDPVEALIGRVGRDAERFAFRPRGLAEAGQAQRAAIIGIAAAERWNSLPSRWSARR